MNALYENEPSMHPANNKSQLADYPAAKADIPELAGVKHVFVKATARVNNRAENSHQPTRERECRMSPVALLSLYRYPLQIEHVLRDVHPGTGNVALAASPTIASRKSSVDLINFRHAKFAG